MNVTLRQMTYFLALVETGSFGRAAARVHVTQPALSMQIRELESSLNARLVERLARGIRLTRAGREVAGRARRILAEVTELEAAARRQGLSRRINLGMIPTVAPYLLPRALPELRAADISRDLRLREAQTAVLLAALDQGQIDAAVVATPAPGAELIGVTLFSDRFLLAGLPDRLHALGAGREALRPIALDPDQLLLLDEGHCLADQALDVCGLDRRRARLDLGASSLATLCGLVGQGFGLTFLPEIAAPTEAAAVPAMALMRFADPEPARRISLIRRRSSEDDGWFDELAAVLSRAGTALVAETRAMLAPPTGAHGDY